jgi:hypothetical protein
MPATHRPLLRRPKRAGALATPVATSASRTGHLTTSDIQKQQRRSACSACNLPTNPQRQAFRPSDIAYREAATRSPSDAGRLEVSPPASAASTKCPGRWPDASGLSRSAIALTAQSADEAGDDLARGPCEMPGMPPGSATVVSASAAGERTGIDCAGLPVRSSAGTRAERGAGAGRARCARTVVLAAGQ